MTWFQRALSVNKNHAAALLNVNELRKSVKTVPGVAQRPDMKTQRDVARDAARDKRYCRLMHANGTAG